MAKKLIIGHRGGMALAKENTMAAFRNAVALGLDMIELDIRKNKNGIMVANHDETISPEAPLFEEVLAYTQNKIKLDVELKEEGYEKEAVELILRYFEKNDFVITSFNDATVRAIKKLFPELRVGLILNEEKNSKEIKELGVDFLALHWKLLKPDFLNRGLFVWTVNDEKMLKRLLLDKRVAGIITDQPDLALKIRKNLPFS
ncbi:MAG: glycerophosphodiester phosphodiesterase [bacterium]